jgi:hypothetical protein
MITNNGFVCLKEVSISNPAESKRRGWVRERTIRRNVGYIIVGVITLAAVILAFYLAGRQQKKLDEAKNPILWVTADMVVQKVELSDGTTIGKQDPRVWKYIHHKPSYRTEFISD